MKTHLKILFVVVIANYLAQIVYRVHLYHSALGQNFAGALLLGGTFLLFIIPYMLIMQGKRSGYIGMLIFLVIEFVFYLENFVGSIIQGYAPFYQLSNPDPILFTAFLIGYINFLAAGYFIYYFFKNRPWPSNLD
jgi:hypothetical protein